MAEVTEVELVIDGADVDLSKAIVDGIGPDASAELLKTSRAVDFLAVIVAATAAAKLLSALLDLREKLKKAFPNKKVDVKNENGDSLDLFTATKETLEAFVGLSGAVKS
ncbi:hypothetical protein ACC848_05495 [Rhizobium johnstonii]|uniref:hypothetical protein n=1 Tax=Rhizobium johnstonii TaxID=3019933 RepID=UPI003F982800